MEANYNYNTSEFLFILIMQVPPHLRSEDLKK